MNVLLAGIFGAVCVAGGYLAGTARSQIIYWKAANLMKDIDKAQQQIELLREETLQMLENSDVME